MAVSQWLHADCIADYYGTDVFSDEHFKIIGNYMKKAAENGLNMILTPVFTPPLDTAVGGERRTTQLVDVYRDGGVWRFGFSRLQKWVKIARKAGIKYFEISHLYTQWGAAHAPKIMGWEDGEFKRLFGWETDALSGEYRGFLRAFLPALISEMGRLGEDKNCVFHISDEPSLSNLEEYRAAKEQVADILDGYRITDALSNFDFYKTGTVEHPIPSTDEIAPFIDAGIDGLWTYYCGAQDNKVSNRFVAMPQARTRVIGFQFWKYNIAGFLHWGYNFWNSKESIRQIDPYQITDGDYFVPAGDCFSVYPGKNGVPYETLRLKAFADALADARALRLAESIIGREALEKTLSTLGTDLSSISFDSYPSSPDWLLSMRETVNNLIETGDAGDTVLS